MKNEPKQSKAAENHAQNFAHVSEETPTRENERITEVAARILKKYRAAFEELAK